MTLSTTSYPAAAPRNRLLWAACVMTKALPDRLRAARLAGFAEMSIFPIDLKRWEAGGRSIGELLTLSKREGVRFTILDPCTKWVPNWEAPATMSTDDVAFTNIEVDDFFRMARALGVNRINLIETFGLPQDFGRLVENLRSVCDRALPLGLRVGVEFMPFSHIAHLETAHELIEAADRQNLGYVLDTWHYYRGKVNNALLATIPTKDIVALQIADADRVLRGQNLMDDLMHYRRTPGKGEFPLADVLKIVLRDGHLREAGVEVFSDEYNAMTADDAAQAASDGLTALFASNDAHLGDQPALTVVNALFRACWRGDRKAAAALTVAGSKLNTSLLDRLVRDDWRRCEALVDRVRYEGSAAILDGTEVLDAPGDELPQRSHFTARLEPGGSDHLLLTDYRTQPLP